MLISNPAAGRRAGSNGVAMAVEILAARGWQVEVRETSGAGEATHLARVAVGAAADAVLVAGGDGTLNEAIQALAGSPTALGYVPSGTVNVWARELGIPLDPTGAATALADGEVRTIDLGRANNRYFLLMAGLGLDGVVVERARAVERYKRRLGILPYVAVTLLTAPTYRSHDLELRYDGLIRRVRAAMLVVGNTRLYGGYLQFTPDAVANDGCLDLCIVKGKGPLSLLQHAMPLLLHRTVGRADVELLRVRELTVTAREPVPFQLDGEPAGKLPVHITIAPAALRVMVPRNHSTGLIA